MDRPIVSMCQPQLHFHLVLLQTEHRRYWPVHPSGSSIQFPHLCQCQLFIAPPPRSASSLCVRSLRPLRPHVHATRVVALLACWWLWCPGTFPLQPSEPEQLEHNSVNVPVVVAVDEAHDDLVRDAPHVVSTVPIGPVVPVVRQIVEVHDTSIPPGGSRGVYGSGLREIRSRTSPNDRTIQPKTQAKHSHPGSQSVQARGDLSGLPLLYRLAPSVAEPTAHVGLGPAPNLPLLDQGLDYRVDLLVLQLLDLVV